MSVRSGEDIEGISLTKSFLYSWGPVRTRQQQNELVLAKLDNKNILASFILPRRV